MSIDAGRAFVRISAATHCMRTSAFASFLHDLAVQFLDLTPKKSEHAGPPRCQRVLPPCFRGRGSLPVVHDLQPALLLHSREQWIQSAWAHLETVPAQLLEDPLTIDGPGARVMQDVDLPECEQNFARNPVCHQRHVTTLMWCGRLYSNRRLRRS